MAGAMTVAMFAGTMPALASNGHGLGLGLGIGMSLHGEAEHGRSGRSEGDEANEEMEGSGSSSAQSGLAITLNQIKTLQKEIRGDLKGSASADATSTVQIAARKQCKKDANSAYQAATQKARDDRDTGLKSALQTYLAALLSARDAYHASLGAGAIVSASGTTVTGSASGTASVDARLAYRQAVKSAQQAFRTAKQTVMTAYRAELKAARAVRQTEAQACKA